MRIVQALIKSSKDTGKLGVKYLDKIWWYDPYGFEASKEAGKMTEFRCDIGGFGEFLLWNHPSFSPKKDRRPFEDFFDPDPNEKDEDGNITTYIAKSDEHLAEYNRYKGETQLIMIKNMHKCNDFEPLTEEDT